MATPWPPMATPWPPMATPWPPMSATTLSLTVEPGVLGARWPWAEFESLVVQMSRGVRCGRWGPPWLTRRSG